MSRINSSFKNLFYSIASQFAIMLLSFIVRTSLISNLGTEYLGINGLFGSIISMLSLAELGIGTAIVFDLYRPLAKNNTNEILQLMNLYKSAYRVIAGVILILGLLITPFLELIIKDDITFINAPLIFILFLFQSVSSYLFFAYKSSLIRADQKGYIISKVSLICTIISNIVQIFTLNIFGNFTIYIVINIISNLAQNYIISRKVNELYPYIHNKVEGKIASADKRRILSNCYAIFIYNINTVVLNATDNILLSAFIGLHTVGLYSNYIMITNVLKNILRMFYNSISASIGNLNATATAERKKQIFEVTNLITFWCCGIASIGFYILINELITIWLGNNYVLSNNVSLLISIDILMFGIQKSTSVYRSSMGLFKEGMYRPIFGIFINLLLSYYLVQSMSVVGVLIGTIVANLLTYVWYDPFIIYKYGFNSSVKVYYYRSIIYLALIFISGAISLYFCSWIQHINLVSFIWKILICTVIPSVMFVIFNSNTDEFKYIRTIVKRIWKSNIKGV